MPLRSSETSRGPDATAEAGADRRGAGLTRGSTPADAVLDLQRQVGNRAVGAMIARYRARLSRQDAGAGTAADAGAPPPAPRPVTQADYAAAVALLQGRNATVYNLLSRGQVGQTVRARTETLPLTGAAPGGPTQMEFRFDLQINSATTRLTAVAEFDRRDEAISTAPPLATVTQLLPINIRPLAPNATPSDLADALLHEGTHAVLHMDRLFAKLAPGARNLQSPLQASFASYLTRARQHPDAATVQIQLEAFIGLTPGLTPAQSRRGAAEVFDRVVEERFAADQHLRGPAPNAAIARTYVVNELVNLGVRATASDVTVAQAITLMTGVLASIPAPGTPAPPSTGSPDAGAPAPTRTP